MGDRIWLAVALVAVSLAAGFGAGRAAGAPDEVELAVVAPLPADLGVPAPGRWRQTTIDTAREAGREVGEGVDGLTVEATVVDDGSAVRLVVTADDDTAGQDQVGQDRASRAMDAMLETLVGRVGAVQPDGVSPLLTLEPEETRRSPSVLAGAIAAGALVACLAGVALLWTVDGRWFDRLIDGGGQPPAGRASWPTMANFDRPQIGTMLAVATPVSAGALAWLGLGTVGDVMVVAAGGVAVSLLPTRMQAVTTVGWLWLVTPMAGRLADWAGGVLDPRPLSLLPLLAALVAGGRWIDGASLIRGRGRLLTTMVAIGLAGAVFGVVEGAWRGEAAGLLLWLAPLAMAAVLVGGSADTDGDAVLDWLVAAAVVAAVVAIVQWLVLPPWDEAWIRGAVISSLGEAAPRSFRPFGPLHAPAVLAVLLAAGLVAVMAGRVLAGRSLPRLAVVGVLAAALVLSEQRTSWLAAAVALAALALAAPQLRAGIGRAALAVLAVAVVAFAASDGARAKLERSVVSISADASASARLASYEALVTRELLTPTGAGLGSVGVAATAEGTSTVSVDGVLPRDGQRLGGPLTIVHAATLVALAVLAMGAARAGVAPGAAGVVLVGLVAGLGTDSVAGTSAMVTWVGAGLILSISRPGPSRPRPGPRR